ncbi:transcriptional regulator PpsR [Marivita sp. GX14005]|uniref:transcriptional regulator PpsR n=1 Tax=Marivita sp. GX14005 TaxID=2942276 RepID=UPI00201A1E67|nr:transcriptional regulator PpsR [Marivita sp. GX14005]MCL3883074.1 transcriptional regulator PpsR [Marivita sp. GX14005]
MTSRGTKYWDSGAVPLIAPEILGNIIASLADLAIVITAEGQILSVLTNPSQRSYGDLKAWEHGNFRQFLTSESVPKFERALKRFLDADGAARPVELNHSDHRKKWQFPVKYSFHTIGPDKTLLMLGRDMQPVAEMQQQLVKAQIALEKDYEKKREFDTHFHVLLGQVSDAVLFVSMSDGRITEANEAAARMLGTNRESILGSRFAQQLQGIAHADLMDRLAASALSEDALGIEIRTSLKGDALRVLPTLFRAAGERIFLCRLNHNDTAPPKLDDFSRHLVALFENGPDGVVMTDETGAITSVNEAFLDFVDAADGRGVHGRLISDFLARGMLDQKVLMDHAAQAGNMRLYTTRVVGEYGGERSVTIATTRLSADRRSCFAFVLRDAQTRDTPLPSGLLVPEKDSKPLVELVGSASLKDIVAQTTDVIEKMCIETAIELTNNNRVAAANMLGLSRQSLYVKLRKYDLLAKDG